MRRIVVASILALAIAQIGIWPQAPVAGAQAAPYCGPGERPLFLFGFATLKAQLGAIMGEPAECQHFNPANGDALLQTTTRPLVTGHVEPPTFTDGYRHWANTPLGLLFWLGDAIDPPPTTLAVLALAAGAMPVPA